MLCPSCNGDSFSERSSFKTVSEAVLGGESTGVVVDLMNCTRCGADFPAVRGRRRYALVGEEKLAALLADLEEAKRTNTHLEGMLNTTSRRSQSLLAEIERCKARAEVSALEARVAALESETEGLSGRRERLASALEVVASHVPG